MRYYKSFSLLEIKTGEEIEVEYPENGKFSFFQWSPNEEKIAFTNTTNSGVELWIVDVNSRKSSKVIETHVNDILNSPFQWFNSNNELLVTLKCDIDKPEISRIPSGPIIQETTNQNAPSRTYQDLIKNKKDELLFEHYACVNLYKVTLNGEVSSIIENRLIKDYELSPDQNYLLTEEIKKPFSYLVPYLSLIHI
mgnify:FL=1